VRFENRPEWMVAAVMYPHIFEGWSLFSPEAPLSDETVVVDAVTRDGRHVDPYNEVGSRVSSLPVDGVPVRLGHDSFWCDYTLRIPDAPQYHQALLEWIQRYHERTGRPQDQIVRFEAFVIWQDSPKPGEPPEPTNIRKRRFLRWPETGGRSEDDVEDGVAAWRSSSATSPRPTDGRRAEPGFGRIVLALILLFDPVAPRRVITLFYSKPGADSRTT
jgi:hypothetical protein